MQKIQQCFLFLSCLFALLIGCQPINATSKQKTALHSLESSQPKSNFMVAKKVEEGKKFVVAQKLVKEKNKQNKVAYVLKKTQELGLPSTLAVVPIVESNYKSQTVSPKGAAGDWQLMPSIAKQYGISNQSRFNFYSSTTVALQYLKELHETFNSWPLALAAYNAGPYRVQHALRKNPETTEVSQLDLPNQTKQYVAKIMRLNQVILST